MKDGSAGSRILALVLLAVVAAAPCHAETEPAPAAKGKPVATPKPGPVATQGKSVQPTPRTKAAGVTQKPAANLEVPPPPPIPVPPIPVPPVPLRGPDLAVLGINGQMGDLSAQVRLGEAYGGRRGVDSHIQRSFSWLKKAAARGSMLAQRDLGIKYLQAELGAPDYAQALPWLQKAADRGSGAAQYELSLLYSDGKGVPKDDGLAYKWLFLAANSTRDRIWGPDFAGKLKVLADRMTVAQIADAKAQAAAFKALPPTPEEEVDTAWRAHRLVGDQDAFRTISERAEQGIAHAQFLLAVMYKLGEGAPRDPGKAVSWYRKAAEQGHAGAQYSLALAYWNGFEVPQDDGEAVVWMRRAAVQGLSVAQEYMGLMYRARRGLVYDESGSDIWYSRAAEQGDAVAQVAVALDYLHGFGTSVDLTRACEWMSLGSTYTDDPDTKPVADQYLEQIKAQLTPAETETCQKYVLHWMPTITAPDS